MCPNDGARAFVERGGEEFLIERAGEDHWVAAFAFVSGQDDQFACGVELLDERGDDGG